MAKRLIGQGKTVPYGSEIAYVLAAAVTADYEHRTVLGSDLSSIQCGLSRERSGRSDMSFWPCVLWLCDEGVGRPSG